jgi:predicted DNA-binding antitoxin AbrB/MazE fold protein
MSIRAIYENGVFKPLEEVPLKEGTEVEVYFAPHHAGNGGVPKRPWKSLKDSPAWGIWKDRDDIGTGAEYVARIRKYRDIPKEK